MFLSFFQIENNQARWSIVEPLEIHPAPVNLFQSIDCGCRSPRSVKEILKKVRWKPDLLQPAASARKNQKERRGTFPPARNGQSANLETEVEQLYRSV